MNVTVVNCSSYDFEVVRKSVDELFENLGGVEKFVKPGQKVLIKANLVRQMTPDKAATTNPMVVAAIAKKLIDEVNAEVIVGDSPGGFFNPQHLAGVYKASGMDMACELSGAKLNDNFLFSQIVCDGKVIKKFECIDMFLNADVVINIAKFKTHSLTGFTGCVKNLFGLIPGLMKVELHTRFSDLNPFCDCLIDIEQFAKDKICLHVLDGVVGMHKDGPTAGEPIHIGKLIASPNPYFVDIVAQQMFTDSKNMPVIMKAIERGILTETFDGLDFDLDSIEKIDGFIPVETIGSMSLYKYPKFVRKFIKTVTSQKVVITKGSCRGCGKCEVHCPNKAIVIKNKKANIKQSQCIKCYCCQELCPFLAVELRKPLGFRLFRLLSGSNKRNRK